VSLGLGRNLFKSESEPLLSVVPNPLLVIAVAGVAVAVAVAVAIRAARPAD
jgi:hypothetical protein